MNISILIEVLIAGRKVSTTNYNFILSRPSLSLIIYELYIIKSEMFVFVKNTNLKKHFDRRISYC